MQVTLQDKGSSGSQVVAVEDDEAEQQHSHRVHHVALKTVLYLMVLIMIVQVLPPHLAAAHCVSLCLTAAHYHIESVERQRQRAHRGTCRERERAQKHRGRERGYRNTDREGTETHRHKVTGREA